MTPEARKAAEERCVDAMRANVGIMLDSAEVRKYAGTAPRCVSREIVEAWRRDADIRTEAAWRSIVGAVRTLAAELTETAPPTQPELTGEPRP